jgi:hypothetical protein
MLSNISKMIISCSPPSVYLLVLVMVIVVLHVDLSMAMISKQYFISENNHDLDLLVVQNMMCDFHPDLVLLIVHVHNLIPVDQYRIIVYSKT